MAIPLAHVVFVLDNSGSMSSYAEETKKAFDAFVDTLKKTKGAEIRLTLIKYGDKARTIYKGVPIQDVGRLEYQPNNCEDTPYDATHYAVKVAEAEAASRPCKTVIVLLCDGGDTSSRMTRESVKALIDAKMKEGWEFCFMVAGADCEVMRDHGQGGWLKKSDVAKRMGFAPESIIQYAQDGRGDNSKAIAAFGASAWNIGAFASGWTLSAAYTDAQKKQAGS